MNIEQMLRDAIERKTAKILKEEYGIETPKKIAEKFIANARMIEPSYAEALVDHMPSVIVRDFTKKAAMTIVAELTKLKADSMLERTVFINSVHKQRL